MARKVQLRNVNSHEAQGILGDTKRSGVDRDNVARIQDAILSGHFVFDGTPIRLNSKGDVIDGLHRLVALAELESFSGQVPLVFIHNINLSRKEIQQSINGTPPEEVFIEVEKVVEVERFRLPDGFLNRLDLLSQESHSAYLCASKFASSTPQEVLSSIHTLANSVWKLYTDHIEETFKPYPPLLSGLSDSEGSKDSEESEETSQVTTGTPLKTSSGTPEPKKSLGANRWSADTTSVSPVLKRLYASDVVEEVSERVSAVKRAKAASKKAAAGTPKPKAGPQQALFTPEDLSLNEELFGTTPLSLIDVFYEQADSWCSGEWIPDHKANPTIKQFREDRDTQRLLEEWISENEELIRSIPASWEAVSLPTLLIASVSLDKWTEFLSRLVRGEASKEGKHRAIWVLSRRLKALGDLAMLPSGKVIISALFIKAWNAWITWSPASAPAKVGTPRDGYTWSRFPTVLYSSYAPRKRTN